MGSHCAHAGLIVAGCSSCDGSRRLPFLAGIRSIVQPVSHFDRVALLLSVAHGIADADRCPKARRIVVGRQLLGLVRSAKALLSTRAGRAGRLLCHARLTVQYVQALSRGSEGSMEKAVEGGRGGGFVGTSLVLPSTMT